MINTQDFCSTVWAQNNVRFVYMLLSESSDYYILWSSIAFQLSINDLSGGCKGTLPSWMNHIICIVEPNRSFYCQIVLLFDYIWIIK
jgi:hypothetical protein